MATVRNVRPSAIRKVEPYAKPASTAFAFRTLVAANENNSANTFAASAAATERVLGVLQKAIASTDSDYASETKVAVEIDVDGVYEFSVDSGGTADANDEQGYIDLQDEDEVDVTTSSVDSVFVTSFVSGTVVLGKIVRWAHLEPPITN